jgi:hypothetical protein
VEFGHIVFGKIDGEASTGRSSLQIIIEADRWGIVEVEVGCRLTDQASHQTGHQAEETSHAATEDKIWRIDEFYGGRTSATNEELHKVRVSDRWGLLLKFKESRPPWLGLSRGVGSRYHWDSEALTRTQAHIMNHVSEIKTCSKS